MMKDACSENEIVLSTALIPTIQPEKQRVFATARFLTAACRALLLRFFYRGHGRINTDIGPGLTKVFMEFMAKSPRPATIIEKFFTVAHLFKMLGSKLGTPPQLRF
jgi:hypothetical protein